MKGLLKDHRKGGNKKIITRINEKNNSNFSFIVNTIDTNKNKTQEPIAIILFCDIY